MDKGLLLCDVMVFKDCLLLIRVDYDVALGDVVMIMGLSGVGKFILLVFIIGILFGDFTAIGMVWLDGHDIIYAVAY